MDILSHALWAGAALVALAPRQRPRRKLVTWTVALAVLPDLMHALPVSAWALWHASLSDWWLYATASPGQEPPMPDMVRMVAHHLHCTFHSGIVAAVVTGLVWAWWRTFWLPLLGWWSHIVIDVFTHSAEYFPSPVIYPLSYWGFDGIAWNEPGFLVLNYAALAVAWWWLLLRRRVAPAA
jgi:hypothetical protein